MKPWLRAYLVSNNLPEDEPAYAAMSFSALKKLAKDRGIRFKAAIRKVELIALLQEDDLKVEVNAQD